MNNLRNYCEKSALIITSSGGGGHIAASNSLKSSLEERKYKNIKVIDTMRSGCSYGEYLGKYSTDLWDNAQKLGDTRTQERLVGSQGVAEAFFFLGAFFTIYCTLMTSNKLPKRVICTQPLHLKAITSAVRLANWQRGSADRKITRIDLYLTDLPTAKAVHFLKALERLKTYSFEKDFDMVRIHTQLSENKTIRKTTRKLFTDIGVKKKNIRNAPLPIAKEFDSVPYPGENCKFNLQTFGVGPAATVQQKEYVIKESDSVALLMLGSVPEESAVMGYLEKFLQSSESLTQREGDCYFFIACGSQDENIVKGSKKLKKNSLYQKVLDRISKEKNLNKKIRIEPFIGQRVFSIFGRSDLSITRSGGLTSAEIIKLKGRFKEGETHRDPKKVCIHSSAKGANASKEALLEAMITQEFFCKI